MAYGKSIIQLYALMVVLLNSAKVQVLVDANIAGLLDKKPSCRYEVVAGEDVFFQCPTALCEPSYKKVTNWTIQTLNGMHGVPEENLQSTEFGMLLYFSPAQATHAGTYLCNMSNTWTKFTLDVLRKENCPLYNNTYKYITTDKNKNVSCPALGCQHRERISNVTWYRTKNFSSLNFEGRLSRTITHELMKFTNLYVEDTDLYICDFLVSGNDSKWIARAIVKLEVNVPDTTVPPRILAPSNGTETMAVLGKPLSLTCKIQFGFESFFNPVMKWTIVYSNRKRERFGGKENCTSGDNGNNCCISIHLEKVTERDLNAAFNCYAQNSVGHNTTTLTLSRKYIDIGILQYLLCATVLLLIMLLLASGMTYLYWTEIVLLYRNYISMDETIGDDKDFDAFISYASYEMSTDTEESSFGSLDDDDDDDGKFATQLLPNVLEDQYNYKLCILERDILPGGAYVEDVASIIKRSRRAIFILSEKYITGPKVFELQAAVTCTLEEKESLKLILIKLKAFKEPESLPNVVKKALNALPMVNWKGDLNGTSSQNKKFWNRIRYYMPVKKVRKGDEASYQQMIYNETEKTHSSWRKGRPDTR